MTNDQRTPDDATKQDRGTTLAAIESAAELIAVHQFDLMAQLEAQLRATRETLVAITKLRDGRHRGLVTEPTNGERSSILIGLSDEISKIDHELLVQHQTCLDQQRLIREMQARLQGLKARVPDPI